MRNILDIYKEYKLPENLQLHQLRVASVAKVLAESYKKESLPIDVIVKACLLHDMGNIVKFKLEQFPDFFEPEGIDYWEKIQKEFIEKYGNDDHKATLAVVHDIGVSDEVSKYVDHIIGDRIEAITDPIVGIVIGKYADVRVGPHGMLSLHDRLNDFRARYVGRVSDEYVDNAIKVFEKAEEDIFKEINLKSEEITDELIEPIIEELKKIEL
jgi:hypothetical protein